MSPPTFENCVVLAAPRLRTGVEGAQRQYLYVFTRKAMYQKSKRVHNLVRLREDAHLCGHSGAQVADGCRIELHPEHIRNTECAGNAELAHLCVVKLVKLLK